VRIPTSFSAPSAPPPAAPAAPGRSPPPGPSRTRPPSTPPPMGMRPAAPARPPDPRERLENLRAASGSRCQDIAFAAVPPHAQPVPFGRLPRASTIFRPVSTYAGIAPRRKSTIVCPSAWASHRVSHRRRRIDDPHGSPFRAYSSAFVRLELRPLVRPACRPASAPLVCRPARFSIKPMQPTYGVYDRSTPPGRDAASSTLRRPARWTGNLARVPHPSR